MKFGSQIVQRILQNGWEGGSLGRWGRSPCSASRRGASISGCCSCPAALAPALVESLIRDGSLVASFPLRAGINLVMQSHQGEPSYTHTASSIPYLQLQMPTRRVSENERDTVCTCIWCRRTTAGCDWETLDFLERWKAGQARCCCGSAQRDFF